jgi:hypothetical protein
MSLQRLLPSLVLTAALFFAPRFASADDGTKAQTNSQTKDRVRVIVVDVVGDALDAGALRETIGRELNATTVAADDPRAATADGRLTIDAKEIGGPMTVRYQTLGAPVSRTVMLPMNPKNAQRAAVFMAGNLARDEANDVLTGMSTPEKKAEKKEEEAKEPPKPPPTPEETAASQAEYARVQRALAHFSLEARKTRRTEAALLGAYALLAIPGGIWVFAKLDGEDPRRLGGITLASSGAMAGGIAVLSLLGLPADPHEKLQAELGARAAAGDAPVLLLEKAERDWATAAEESRRSRHVGGGILVAVSALSIGMSVAVANRTDTKAIAASYGLMASGGISFVLGAHLLLVESPVETSWNTYRAMKGGGTPRGASPFRPFAGISPLPGGAFATAGLAF